MDISEAQKKNLFGHPIGLFILFFTEMWERFSYYGMRALLVLYLIETVTSDNPGLGWSKAEASNLYGWYTMLVYITPIIGGIIADKFLGFRKAIIIGAALMTLGHLSLAFEPMAAFYLGLILLIVGNGFFKPNISSIVGQLYPDDSDLKDSGYTIFYQGINIGAFLGTLICGYLAETKGWHWGFGVAGIFMFIGMIQFIIAQRILGDIGLAPDDGNLEYHDDIIDSVKHVKDEPLTKVEKDRLVVVGVLAFFSIFFWAAFEQAGSSMNIFASEYTNRTLATARQVNIFRIVSLCFSVLPVAILTYLYLGMVKAVGKAFRFALGFMSISIIVLWVIIGYMLYEQFMATDLEVPATWFQTLNALFIFTLAPVFSMIWRRLAHSKLDPNGPQKFAIGLVLLGVGFLPLVIGAAGIGDGTSTYKTSMVWLVLAYLLHTMGELCLSPVGLSYVNKLSPKRLLGVMFGIWFFASALGNKLAGSMSSAMESMSESVTMSGFFTVFVVVPIVAGIALFLLGYPLKKYQHGLH
ncbi:MAG: peptide MFS transporter [Bacteroidetes bacterium]|nr:peptide MFS transporter [Bacteroidota bacterium]